jgi:hypothetical protein
VSNLYGKATIFSTSGSVLAYGSVTNGDRVNQTVTAGNNAETKFLFSQANEPITIASFQANKTIAIDFVPIGGTAGDNTITKAKTYLVLPDVVSKVTLSQMSDSSFDGDYIYMGGGSQRMTLGDYALVSIQLIQYTAVGSDSTSLTTLVS